MRDKSKISPQFRADVKKAGTHYKQVFIQFIIEKKLSVINLTKYNS